MEDKIIKSPNIRFTGFSGAWEQHKLGDIVEFFSGLTYSPDNVIEDGGTFVLRSSNVKNGEIVDADNVYVRSDIVNSDNVQVGDIIVVVRNGSRGLIGKHAQIKKQMNDTVIGAFMTGIRSETPNLVNAVLDTKQFSVEINKNLGATINQITIGAFKEMMFYIPSDKHEREKVGGFFNDIDNLITLHHRKLEVLKDTKKSMLQKMFPQNGENVPVLRFEGFTDVWEQRKLSDVAEYRNGKAHEKDINENGLYIVVNSKFVSTNGLIRKFSNKLIEPLKSGEIVFVLSDVPNGKALARTFLIDEDDKYSLNQRIAGITPNKETDSYFLNILMNRNDYFLKFDNGVGQTNLSKSEVESFPEFYPSYEEQLKIGSFFRNQDSIITLYQRELELLKDLKKSMLKQMFI